MYRVQDVLQIKTYQSTASHKQDFSHELDFPSTDQKILLHDRSHRRSLGRKKLDHTPTLFQLCMMGTHSWADNDLLQHILKSSGYVAPVI